MTKATAKAIVAFGCAGLSAGFAGCASNDSPPQAGGQSEDELLGPTSYDASCRPQDVNALRRAMHYGRAVASSSAFAECVDRSMRAGLWGIGPYQPCAGDPFYGAPIDEQIARVIDAARTPNPVVMSCDGTSGNASAFPGTYGHRDAERFSWSGWLTGVVDSLGQPVCPQGNPCRFADEPWPWSQMAGTVWHEAAHTHGYVHGANFDNEEAKPACGYPPESPFHFQVNTAPYIVGKCLSAVIDQSGRVCGAPITRRVEATGNVRLSLIGVSLIDGVDAATCSTHFDPSVTWTIYELL